MALRGTDPESYLTEYTSVYEENIFSFLFEPGALCGRPPPWTLPRVRVQGLGLRGENVV